MLYLTTVHTWLGKYVYTYNNILLPFFTPWWSLRYFTPYLWLIFCETNESLFLCQYGDLTLIRLQSLKRKEKKNNNKGFFRSISPHVLQKISMCLKQFKPKKIPGIIPGLNFQVPNPLHSPWNIFCGVLCQYYLQKHSSVWSRNNSGFAHTEWCMNKSVSISWKCC